MSTSRRPPPLGRRLLDQKTTWQKAMLAVTAVASFVTVMVALVALGVNLFGARDPAGVDQAARLSSASASSGAANGDVPAGVVTVQNQSAELDLLVRSLVDSAGRRSVALNHQVMGHAGPANVEVNYACGAAGSCSFTRIEVGDGRGYSALRDRDGVLLRGCFSVRLDGQGWRMEPLDIELTHVGETCPS